MKQLLNWLFKKKEPNPDEGIEFIVHIYNTDGSVARTLSFETRAEQLAFTNLLDEMGI